MSSPHPFTISAYRDRLIQHPALGDTAHQRIARMIEAAGPTDADGHPYPFFRATLFGIDAAIRQLVDQYFRPAALGLETRRRIVLLVGPVSSGKSSIATRLKRGLEAFTATPEGQLYAIADCPMHEDPLHLLPMADRQTLADACHRPAWTEGTLCPLCQWRLDHLYGGDPEAFPITPITLSESHRRGIGTYAPSDPKSQDIADLTGSIDFATIGDVGSESDPRAFRFDGELNIANRGLIEFQEMLKLDERFLYTLLSLSQEGNFKTGRYQLISSDTVILGHTNLSEYEAFRANPRNAALLSRMVVIPVPYAASAADEARIYAQQCQPHLGALHVDPTLFATMADWALASRQAPSDPPAPPGFAGLDPRRVHDTVATVLATTPVPCVTTPQWLEAVRAQWTQDPLQAWNPQDPQLRHLATAEGHWHHESTQTLARLVAQHPRAFPHADLASRFVQEIPAESDAYREPSAWMQRLEERLQWTSATAPAYWQELRLGYQAFARQHPQWSGSTQAHRFLATLPEIATALQQIAWEALCQGALAQDAALRHRLADRLVASDTRYCVLCAQATVNEVVARGVSA